MTTYPRKGTRNLHKYQRSCYPFSPTLCRKLNMLFNSYDNRPSREEDVRRIRKLEADAIESRNVAARAREEMAFFKRELLNREENYNKKFNANPVVGVMQVR